MLTVLDHPLARHTLAELRKTSTSPKDFRACADFLTRFLAYEAFRDLRTKPCAVSTPLADTTGERLDEPGAVIVPILRAGMGMLSPVLDLLPDAAVGVLGIQRDEMTALPSVYCAKVPRPKTGEELAVLIDPMLATGGSACDAIDHLKKFGYRRFKFLCLVAAPEGVAKIGTLHPDVNVWAAALDERLNSRYYIVPGLGDAGDRIFGTTASPACG